MWKFLYLRSFQNNFSQFSNDKLFMRIDVIVEFTFCLCAKKMCSFLNLKFAKKNNKIVCIWRQKNEISSSRVKFIFRSILCKFRPPWNRSCSSLYCLAIKRIPLEKNPLVGQGRFYHFKKNKILYIFTHTVYYKIFRIFHSCCGL